MNIRAITYARVSSDAQKENENINVQRHALPPVVAQHGWTLMQHIEDDGISGETIAGRPGFSEIMRLAKARAFDVLVVTKADRLTRSIDEVERAIICKTLREGGVKVFVVNGGGLIDLTNPTHNLLFSITGSFSSFDKQQLVKNMTDGKADKIKDGGRRSCRDPYGYRWAPEPGSKWRGKYEIVPGEAAAIRRMVELSLEGLGTMAISLALEKEGFPVKPSKQNPKSVWAFATVRNTLRSTTIKGEMRALNGAHTVAVPAIIDDETWRRLQLALDRQQNTGRKASPDRKDCLLVGLLRCGVCGYGMWTQRNRLRGNRYYVCNSRKLFKRFRLEGHCGNAYHGSNKIDEEVWTALKSVLTTPGLLARCAALQADQIQSGVDRRAELRDWERRLEHVDELEEEALDRRRRKIISAAACDRELVKNTRQRAAIEMQIESVKSQLANTGDTVVWLDRIEAFGEELRGALDSVDFAERLAVVQTVLPRRKAWVEIHADGSSSVRGVLVAGEEELPFDFAAGLKTA